MKSGADALKCGLLSRFRIPPGLLQIDPASSGTAGPLTASGHGAQCRRFVEIVPDGGSNKSRRRPAVSAKNAPPRHIGTSPRHHRSHLTRAALLKNHGDIPIRQHLSCGDHADDAQDRLFIVQTFLVHQPRVATSTRQPGRAPGADGQQKQNCQSPRIASEP